METKVRWLRSDEFTGPLVKKMSSAIAERRFTPKTDRGFFVNRVRAGVVEGKFIEKVVGKREILDPFGNRLELPFVNYDVVQFRFSSEAPQIELVNPTRSSKRLILYLSEITGESFAVAPLEIDLRRWIDSISRAWGRVSVTEIDFSDVSISANLAADVRFFGTEKVLDGALGFLGPRATAISKAKLSVSVNRRSVSMEISRTGSLKANVELESAAIGELRTMLGEQQP
jgi:hypothetical protein